MLGCLQCVSQQPSCCGCCQRPDKAVGTAAVALERMLTACLLLLGRIKRTAQKACFFECPYVTRQLRRSYTEGSQTICRSKLPALAAPWNLPQLQFVVTSMWGVWSRGHACLAVGSQAFQTYFDLGRTNRVGKTNSNHCPHQASTTPLNTSPFPPFRSTASHAAAASLRCQVLVAQLLQDGHHACGQVWHPAAPQQHHKAGRQAVDSTVSPLSHPLCLPRSSATAHHRTRSNASSHAPQRQRTHAYVMTPKQGFPVTPRSTLHSAAPTLASGAHPIVRPYASGGWKRCTCSPSDHGVQGRCIFFPSSVAPSLDALRSCRAAAPAPPPIPHIVAQLSACPA